jgi:polysaccharide biosynthesis/export protein
MNFQRWRTPLSNIVSANRASWMAVREPGAMSKCWPQGHRRGNRGEAKEPMNVRFDAVAIFIFVFTLLFIPAIAAGQNPVGDSQNAAAKPGYVLGPEDTVFIQVLNVDELANQNEAFRIDLSGYVNVPRIGRIYATGLAADQLGAVIADRFREYLQNPVVTVRVAEFHSKHVSVLGSVGSPGVHTLQGDKTLLEVISEAGGLSPNAGSIIKITRRKDEGLIPLPTATPDPTGDFSVAEVNIREIIDATNPKNNILIRPNDVITVPQAGVVYVIGAVNHSGGFTVSDHQNLSVLEVLSLASGLANTAAAKNAKVLRPVVGSTDRTEIPVNLKKILKGEASDVPLLANDILFVPTSGAKAASLRALQAALQIGTGVAIYSSYRY